MTSPSQHRSRKQAESDAPNDNKFTKPAPPAKKQIGGRSRKKDAVKATTLDELGISEELARCREVAAAPEGWLEQFIKVVGAGGGEITTDGFLAYCKKRRTQKSNLACKKSTTEDA